MKKTHSPFTLAELLVVVTTISVLATLLLPGQKRALEQARLAGCQNNLRMQGIAFALYGSEYDGYPVMQGATAPINWSYSHWKMQLAPYLGVEVDTGAAAVAGGNPGLGEGFFRCPSWENEKLSNPIPAANVHWFGGYGYNWCGETLSNGEYIPLGVGYRVAVKPTDITKPAETIAIGDSNDFGDSQRNMVLYRHTANPTAANPGIGDRHEGGIDLAWADGHVSYMKKEELAAGKAGGNYLFAADQSQYYYRRDK